MKRSDAEEMVEKHGGKLLSGVSSKLNYLVVGEDAGSKLENLGLTLESRKETARGGSLLGKTFLFTGTLQKMKRSEAEEMVEKQGGKLLSGVSSKLNYLVVGEDAGSKLEKARKIPQIHILDEDAFIKISGYGAQ
jgi:DNA ligase (NAD+)